MSQRNLPILRLLVINALVLAGLLLVTNFLSAVVTDGHSLFRRLHNKSSPPDVRAFLPAFKDRKQAVLMFTDIRKLTSQYRPFVGWDRLPYKGPTTTIGKDGRRTFSTSTPPLPDAKIARFFGGSTMWGTGSDDAGTIPAQFQRMDPQYLAINHGETGYNIRQNLADLINVLNQYEHSDLIIFYAGANDVVTLCRIDTEINGHGQEALVRSRLENSAVNKKNEGSVLLNFIYEIFLKHTAFVIGKLRNRSERFDTIKIYNCDKNPIKAQQVANTIVRNLQIGNSLAKLAGAQFFAILQPVAFVGNPQRDYLKLESSSHTNSQYQAVYPLLQKKIQELNQDWLVDWTNAFDGQTPLYIDFVHVTANGNQIIAHRVVDLITQNNLRSKSTASQPSGDSQSPFSTTETP